MNRRVAIAAGLALLATGCTPQSEARRTRPAFLARTRPVGRSMLPTFGDGEEVELELCAFSECRAGDTIVYWHNESGQYVHHRLTERSVADGLWLAKGDNNAGRDWGRVTADEFVGRTRKLIA